MTHLFQLTLETRPDWIVIKTDAHNAFNSVSRAEVLSQVANHFPELSTLSQNAISTQHH